MRGTSSRGRSGRPLWGLAWTCALAGCGAAGIDTRVEAARERLAASEGGRIVLAAIEAHGGLEAWYGAPTSSYTWEYSNLGSNVRFESFLVADNSTRRVYHELRTFGTPEAVRVASRDASPGTGRRRGSARRRSRTRIPDSGPRPGTTSSPSPS